MAKPVTQRHDVIPLLAEVFRTYGYEGASLARIGHETGLGKGSLYHFFPGGKEEMAAAVLAHIDDWFQRHIFTPLRRDPDPRAGLEHMFEAVSRYFLSGRKACLVGVFALGNERDRYADAVAAYFRDWMAAVASALRRAGLGRDAACVLAEDIVGGIQGALVMARACNDAAVFARLCGSLRARARKAMGLSAGRA